MSMQDFQIQDSILIKYTGSGGEVMIPDGIAVIGERAFSQCTALTSVRFPDSVENIGYEAFYGCNNLRSVSFGKGLAVISYGAFSNCENLVSVAIPESILSIRNYAFYGCIGLQSLSVGNSTAVIGGTAFSGCPSLSSLKIKDIVLKGKVLKSFRRYCSQRESVCFSNMINAVIRNEYRYLPKEMCYNVLWQLFFLCPENKEFFNTIKANCRAFLFYLIEEKEQELFQKVLDFGGFVTEKNIDTCIQFSIDKQSHQIQLMLTDYKYQHFEFKTPADKFKL